LTIDSLLKQKHSRKEITNEQVGPKLSKLLNDRLSICMLMSVSVSTSVSQLIN